MLKYCKAVKYLACICSHTFSVSASLHHITCYAIHLHYYYASVGMLGILSVPDILW